MTSRSRESWPGQPKPGGGAGQSGKSSRKERRSLSHLDRLGRPRMVDVSGKPPTARRAVAETIVTMDQETLTLIIDGAGPKGDVLNVAELAGIMGAKRTAELIPLCHPLPLSEVTVEIRPERKSGGLRITTSAATTASTGVEMEAMTAAAVAALTVYDMVKSADPSVSIDGLKLLEKSGGKSGRWRRPEPDEAGQGTASAAPKRAREPRTGSGSGTKRHPKTGSKKS